MPSFPEHIKQAKRNLTFLANTNNAVSDCWDWQVTICFYSALHLMSAHLANKGLQYRTHKETDTMLNPYSSLSVGKIPEPIYLAYSKLMRLSRRARYMIDEKNPASTRACYISEKHFSKALRNLDAVLTYFSEQYETEFVKAKIVCSAFKSEDLVYFYKK